MKNRIISISLAVMLALSFGLIGCEQPCTTVMFSITEGNVSVMKGGTANWTEAQVEMCLKRGDIIRCGENSSGQMTFLDGTIIDLEAGDEIEVASLHVSAGNGSNIIEIKLTIGSIIFRVNKIIDPASRYEVETPTGTVAIRGSAVQVSVIEDGTTWATNLEGDIVAIAQGVELQVPEGRRCIISPDQPPELVIFTDPNLEAMIREAIDKPTGEIYASDLQGLTSLDDAEMKYTDWETFITDITGLEYCTSLTYLNLWDNQISDISPLANLTNLTYLFLGYNQISDISPLANLTNLTSLFLHANSIDDISPLANLTNLTEFSLDSHEISEIALVVDLTRLTELSLGHVTDISGLADLTNLTSLNLRFPEIGGDITPLANLTNLTSLFVLDAQISDISPLANLTDLTQLYLLSNQISDITPLVENEGLGTGDYVDLRRNPLSSDSINVYIPQLQARGVTVDY